MANAGPSNMLRRLAQRAQAPAGESELQDRAQLRDMIERKRRNDMVRKRELDMLRRVRHEGLTPEQAAELDAPNSGLGDLDPLPVADGSRMRAKIDEIEQAMVGLPRAQELRAPMLTRPLGAGVASTIHAYAEGPLTDAPQPTLPSSSGSPASGPEPAPASDATPPEIDDMRHDPVLDVAVMAFASGDTAASEAELRTLLDGACQGDADTWLVLADLYRATGQQGAFESLALSYSNRFGRSPPQWFSLPELAQADLRARGRVTLMPDAPVWTAPARCDDAAAAALRRHLALHPAPWILDWSAVTSVTPTGAQGLVEQARAWADQEQTMHWRGAEALLAALEAATRIGQRDVQPVMWLARMAMLRLVGRPQAFENAALDYCVTYEVSPPSWEPVRCVVQADSAQSGATTALLSQPPGGDSAPATPVELTLPLVGAWAGDVGGTLAGWTDGVLAHPNARLTLCAALLTRIDFNAASDLLNWVTARRHEGRELRFVDLHRLTALMLSIMGVSAYAPLYLRRT